MNRRTLAVALAAALSGFIAVPALAQNAAPSAGALAVTVTVTNSRKTDLVQLQAAESGSADWKKVLGALKAGKQGIAKFPQDENCRVTCTGPSPTARRWTRPTSTSARKRR